jgi:hypothetical protein
MAKRVVAKTAPKRRVTKTKAKRGVTNKSPIKAPEPPRQGEAAAETVTPAAAETVTPDVIDEPVSEATRVHGS